MQLTTAILSLSAASASAAPASARKFGIMALRSATPIHFTNAGAFQNQMILSIPDNKADAECADGKTRTDAIFYIENAELYLYGNGETLQQFAVDRSSTGQGVVRYFHKTGTVTNDNLELKGWAVDAEDNLTFNGNGLLACPNPDDGSWAIWISVGIEEPGSFKGCLGFTGRTQSSQNPVQCAYSDRVMHSPI